MTSRATSTTTVWDDFWICSPITSTQPPATPDPDARDGRRDWYEGLAAMRHRAALEQGRSPVGGVPAEDAGQLNRWFYRLDRLLNRDGGDDADSDDADGPDP